MGLHVPELKAKALEVIFAVNLKGEKPFRGILETIDQNMLIVRATQSPPLDRPIQFNILQGPKVVLHGTAKIVESHPFDENQNQFVLQLLQVDSDSIENIMDLFDERQKNIKEWMKNLNDE